MNFELRVESGRLQVAGTLDPSVTHAIEKALRQQALPVELDLSRTEIGSHVALAGLAKVLLKAPFVGLVNLVGITHAHGIVLRYLGVVTAPATARSTPEG